jgi:hypothetical protein
MTNIVCAQNNLSVFVVDTSEYEVQIKKKQLSKTRVSVFELTRIYDESFPNGIGNITDFLGSDFYKNYVAFTQ